MNEKVAQNPKYVHCMKIRSIHTKDAYMCPSTLIYTKWNSVIGNQGRQTSKERKKNIEILRPWKLLT